MNPNTAYLAALIRAAILLVAGERWASPEDQKSIGDLVAAVAAGLTIVWSLYQKRAANELLRKAAEAPAGASIDDIKARK